MVQNSKFQSKTWVKLWQITQNFLDNHFTNAIIQKLIKLTVNNYKAYVRMKNKVIKMQHSSLCTLIKVNGNSIWNTKQSSLKKIKLNFSVNIVIKKIRFVIKKIPAQWSWYARNIFATLPHEMGSEGLTKGNN